KSDLGSGEMHGSTAASRASIGPAIKLCSQFVSASAFGKKVIVASMMGVDDIVRSKRMANANSNSLLSRSEMGGRSHFLLLVAFSKSFLGQPNLLQILVQRDKEIRSRHACRHILVVTHAEWQRPSTTICPFMSHCVNKR